MLKWKLRSERDCWTFSSSLCYGVEIKNGEDDNVDALDAAVCPMKDCKSKTTIQGKNLTRIVGDLRLKVPCKNRDAGCTHKCIEDEMEEHQDECEDRKVSCDFCRRNVPFKDLLHHLRDKHKVDYDAKKWLMEEPTEKYGSPGYEDAYMFETGPDGLVFTTDIIQNEGHFRIAVKVMGGKQVCKKYRAELRISSNKLCQHHSQRPSISNRIPPTRCYQWQG